MRLAAIFSTFGPYHYARLNALARYHDVLGIEVYSKGQIYSWNEAPPDCSFRKATLFGGQESPAKPVAIRSALDDAISRFAPDAIAVPGWSTSAGLMALDLAIMKRIPSILMADSQAMDKPRLTMVESVKGRIVRLFSSALVAGSRHTAYVQQLGLPGSRIFEGFDVVDNAYFENRARESRANALELRERLGLPLSYVLCVSRLIKRKNLETLIRAFAELPSEGSYVGARNAHLLILGDGPLHDRLVELTGNLGLSDRVHLKGFVQYHDLPAYYALADYLVIPSASEQWGLVVNEAMACGLPVVASSKCGCVPELVKEGRNGFVFEPDDLNALSAIFNRLNGDEGLRARLGSESARIVADWDLSRFSESMERAAKAALGVAPGACGPLLRLLLYLVAYWRLMVQDDVRER